MTATRISPPTPQAIAEAAEMLRRGHIVALPTETVYGLGADARSDDAIARIYAAKGRPATNPLIVHVADTAAARRYVAVFPPAAQTLADAFWPGPLTLILPRAKSLSPRLSAGLATVAIRCPAHPVALDLLRTFDGPIAAPSANRSGFTSPTTAQHVYAELNARVPLILDGGPCAVGVESTVLDLTTATPAILRHGAITSAMLAPLIGPVLAPTPSVRPDTPAPSPGMLDRHYAPATPAFRFAKPQWPAAQNWIAQQPKVVLLTTDPALTPPPPHEAIVLPADAAACARVLYASLREADTREGSSLLVLMPDTSDGLWAAIADRLRRATVPLPPA